MATRSQLVKPKSWLCAHFGAFAFAAGFSVNLFASNDEVHGEFSFAKLEAIVADDHVKSIEDVLSRLPLDFRGHYVLLFRSRSLHESSYENPRVLLYGKDAKLIVSFNGSPSQRGYQALETMEFNEAAAEFNYREILFSNGAGGGKATISDANPEKCQRCHNRPARPIWDTFPTWPGAFGERYRKPLSSAEQLGLDAFMLRQASHPRYRYLEGASRFSVNDFFATDVRQRLTYNGGVQNPPNVELGSLLSRMNFQAIAKDITSSPRFFAFAPVLLRSLNSACGDFATAIPEALRLQFHRSYDEFRKIIIAANEQQNEVKARRSLIRSDAANLTPETVVRFLYLVEEGLGISTGNWTTALEKGTYDFTSFEQGLAELGPLLLVKADSRTQSAEVLRQTSERYCARLDSESLRALTDLSPRSETAAEQPNEVPKTLSGQPPALIKLCIACHETGAGPAIPFSKPGELALSLAAGAYPRGKLLDEILYRLSTAAGSDQMPRGLNISEMERAELRRYFSNLARSH